MAPTTLPSAAQCRLDEPSLQLLHARGISLPSPLLNMFKVHEGSRSESFQSVGFHSGR